jgi:hypothetical protein
MVNRLSMSMSALKTIIHLESSEYGVHLRPRFLRCSKSPDDRLIPQSTCLASLPNPWKAKSKFKSNGSPLKFMIDTSCKRCKVAGGDGLKRAVAFFYFPAAPMDFFPLFMQGRWGVCDAAARFNLQHRNTLQRSLRGRKIRAYLVDHENSSFVLINLHKQKVESLRIGWHHDAVDKISESRETELDS